MSFNQKAFVSGFLDSFGNVGQVNEPAMGTHSLRQASSAPSITSRADLSAYKRSLRKRFLTQQPGTSVGQRRKP